MKKTKAILKVVTILFFIFGANIGNAQVSDALLTAEMNNGNNTESTEITGSNWKIFETNVSKLFTASNTYAQVYLELTINGTAITIIPDYIVKLASGKYKIIDAKASSITDLSVTGTPDLTNKLTSNQKIAYPAINASALTAKIKTARGILNNTGTAFVAGQIINLEIGVDFYVNTPKAQYTSSTKRTLK